ncbi:MAG: RecQ family ATP-dependent DNA helicase [Bacteroidetes bacterium]|nr:RecQ family ATP-dependent DNA helicase [Bacteroidota bacterium]
MQISFFDFEVNRQNVINDIGCIKSGDISFHANDIKGFVNFIRDEEYICGHNVLLHDLKYIQSHFKNEGLDFKIIDTLLLSPLLFPSRPYHRLLKDDKLQTDELNNPLNDSIKARDLFYEEVASFRQLDKVLQAIYHKLLGEKPAFKYFFEYLDYTDTEENIEGLLRQKFNESFCENTNLTEMIQNQPIELAYCLALLYANDRYSITPPWVARNYPKVERVMHLLRNKPCLGGCTYCNKALDPHAGLKKFFNFDNFRTYANEPLQEKAVRSAIDNKSLLAVFPTGGGKSITFQVPALMSGQNVKGLTVIISPLQSLMKDQVDNLEKSEITEAVTINGLLDPIERSKAIERVHDGSASMLYISPESLRSKTIEKLLLGRKLVRFVIDEAHCFSSWGQDFRVDYLYIGDFIKNYQQKKNLENPIPISCFTATAKREVIEDICKYFREKLSLELEIFRSPASRTNLQYQVFDKSGEEEKYNALRDLISSKNTPTIVYVSRTKRAYSLAERLKSDGFDALPYHGKMDVKEKTLNQTAFVTGKVQVMVATSAFGMGVDKKDVGMVIHYDISDSLENYVQEAGRAGRDENILADCFVLYNEEDLSKHFILLNQTKLSLKEVQDIWRAIKYLTKFKPDVSNSALEIARRAGWNEDVAEIETRVKTAISALEEAGYLKRGQNMPRVFANSILSKTAQDAIDKISASNRLNENQKIGAIRIIKKLFSSKSRKQASDEAAESRIDYISDDLGIVREEVIRIITLLREEKILADNKDLSAFIKKGENEKKALDIFDNYRKIENFLLKFPEETEQTINLKELNSLVAEEGIKQVTVQKIKTILNFWAIKNWIKRSYKDYAKNQLVIIRSIPKETLGDKCDKRHFLARLIINYLFDKIKYANLVQKEGAEEAFVEFSVQELKDAAHKENAVSLIACDYSTDDIEDTLFYLSRIEALKIEGGFMVVYNRLSINRLEKNPLIQFKKDDYEKLDNFYQNKIRQIHIVGEYAKTMIEDDRKALELVNDYFNLNNYSFLNKYFPGSRQNEIKRNITPAKHKELFGSLSPTQKLIIEDNESQHIVILAGPGSGKTKVLVHKLASLLLMEDVKHEQLLMLTFSRAAATEFKKRLIELIGNAAGYVEIKTFHSYCFDLLGKVGNLNKSDFVIQNAIEQIKSGEVEASKITKTVLVIDEAQDMNTDEFQLVQTLMDQNENMRVIAVGDDDQNIYEFRGANSKYLEKFMVDNKAKGYELLTNYRSKSNLVEFANQFLVQIQDRLKENPIVANQDGLGKIKITRYQCQNLISPLIADILNAPLSGTTCVLTKSNEEAMLANSLLNQHKIKTRLIQSNDSFNLYNLFEIRSFLDALQAPLYSPLIDDELWNEARKAFKNNFSQSSNFEACINLISDFEKVNVKVKYRSDFDAFIRESSIEDFINVDTETVVVSTIHKAKGKEFDNVFILLDNFNPKTDEEKRQLYVAMTRAKQNLVIHYNGKYFESTKAQGLEKTQNPLSFAPINEMLLNLSHKDVQLGYFEFVQKRMSILNSGDILSINKEGCTNKSGEQVLKFSKTFQEKLMQIEKTGFALSQAKINFILYWKKPGTEMEWKILLPELKLERNIIPGTH